MKHYDTFTRNFLALNLVCCAAFVNAQPAITSVELSAGVEQDSNLNIVELDQNTQQSDTAALLAGKIDGKWQANEKWLLSGGYAFSAKNYQNYSEYNLLLNQISGDANYDMGPFTLGASYHYVDANLNKKDFLALQQTSIYVSKLINNQIYLRAALNLQDKKFADHRERNAENLGFAGDAFIFFNEGKTFVTLGLGNEAENAGLHQLDYSANTLRVKLSHQYVLWDQQQKLQLGWRYAVRDYTGVNADIERKRDDAAHVSELEWEINFTSSIAAVSKIERGDYDSNLPAAKYSETRTSITLKLLF